MVLEQVSNFEVFNVTERETIKKLSDLRANFL